MSKLRNILKLAYNIVVLLVLNGKINSFGTDENGNIYIVIQKLFGPKSPTGVIYKLSY